MVCSNFMAPLFIERGFFYMKEITYAQKKIPTAPAHKDT